MVVDAKKVTDDEIHMKVSCKHPIVFYIKSALSFFKGQGDDKPPVSNLKISGLGNAINVAIACASRCEKEGMGSIEKINTNYVAVESNGKTRSCAQVEISMKRSPNADKIIAENLKNIKDAAEE